MSFLTTSLVLEQRRVTGKAVWCILKIRQYGLGLLHHLDYRGYQNPLKDTLGAHGSSLAAQPESRWLSYLRLPDMVLVAVSIFSGENFLSFPFK